MYYMLLVIHYMVCVLLVLIVLLQRGKGSDLANTLGGGLGGQTFGSVGAASLINKITTGLAVAFMAMSLTLGILKTNGGGSVTDSFVPPPAPVPVVPVGAGLGGDQGGADTGSSNPSAPSEQGAPQSNERPAPAPVSGDQSAPAQENAAPQAVPAEQNPAPQEAPAEQNPLPDAAPAQEKAAPEAVPAEQVPAPEAAPAGDPAPATGGENQGGEAPASGN